MEALAWVLAALFLVLTVALLWRRSSDAAERTRLVSERDGLATDLDAARTRLTDAEQSGADASSRAHTLELRVTQLEGVLASNERAANAELDKQAEVFAERVRSLEREREELRKQQTQLKESVGTVAADAVRQSRDDLLKQAKEFFGAKDKQSEAEQQERRRAVEQLVKPIGETLGKTQHNLARLQQQVEGLDTETGKLVRALSRPEVRGRYGEIQLRRVAELAGMLEWCDFDEQCTVRADDGSALRPDMLVRLPNDRVVAVDAKANLDAYLTALNTTDSQEQARHLDRFARHVQDQVDQLAKKSYWSAFEGSPEFVVMFVPGDHFLDAALSRRPELLERAAEGGVILASPATLIGLLRAVAVGWREHRLAEKARELLALGQELHNRAGVVFERAGKLSRALGTAVSSYNDLVASMETRLRPTLRKFEDAGVKSAKTIVDPKPVATLPREPTGEQHLLS